MNSVSGVGGEGEAGVRRGLVFTFPVQGHKNKITGNLRTLDFAKTRSDGNNRRQNVDYS